MHSWKIFFDPALKFPYKWCPALEKIGEKYIPKRKKYPKSCKVSLLATGFRKSALRYPVLEKRGEIDTRKGVHITSAKYTKYPQRGRTQDNSYTILAHPQLRCGAVGAPKILSRSVIHCKGGSIKVGRRHAMARFYDIIA